MLMERESNSSEEIGKTFNQVDTDTKQTEDEEDPYRSQKYLFFASFAFLGLINNLGYVLIITSAQQFAKKLNNQSLIACYPLALNCLSSLTRFINSKFCITFSYFKRLLGLTIYFCTGCISLFIILTVIQSYEDFDTNLAFFLTLLPSIMMGTGLSFGEATILGYIRIFPKDYVSGWSSGTGLAGLVGASLSLIFKYFSFDLKNLYLFITPVYIFYFLAFFLTFKLKQNIDKSRNLIKEETKEETKDENKEQTSDNLPVRTSDLLNENYNNQTDVALNENMSVQNFIKAFSFGKRYILNLFFIYFLEYTICSGLSEKSNRSGYIDSKGSFFNDIQYETILLCYQLGVFISRSSLAIVKHLTFIELLTIFQTIFFILWFIESETGFISNQWVCFISLILVGLCGGGTYVGCFYFIFKDEKVPPKLKELCVNISTIFNDLGVLLSSIVCIVLNFTIWKK